MRPISTERVLLCALWNFLRGSFKSFNDAVSVDVEQGNPQRVCCWNECLANVRIRIFAQSNFPQIMSFSFLESLVTCYRKLLLISRSCPKSIAVGTGSHSAVNCAGPLRRRALVPVSGRLQRYHGQYRKQKWTDRLVPQANIIFARFSTAFLVDVFSRDLFLFLVPPCARGAFVLQRVFYQPPHPRLRAAAAGLTQTVLFISRAQSSWEQKSILSVDWPPEIGGSSSGLPVGVYGDKQIPRCNQKLAL